MNTSMAWITSVAILIKLMRDVKLLMRTAGRVETSPKVAGDLPRSWGRNRWICHPSER